jgi:hypothetical protein
MEHEIPDRQTLTIAKIVIKFLLGAIIGSLLVVILYSNFQFSVPTLANLQMICSCLFVIACGILSAIWGSKFLGVMLQALTEASWL